MAMSKDLYLSLVLSANTTSLALLETCQIITQRRGDNSPEFQAILEVMMTQLKIRATILAKINPRIVKSAYETGLATPYVSEFNELIKLNMELDTYIRRSYNKLL